MAISEMANDNGVGIRECFLLLVVVKMSITNGFMTQNVSIFFVSKVIYSRVIQRNDIFFFIGDQHTSKLCSYRMNNNFKLLVVNIFHKNVDNFII